MLIDGKPSQMLTAFLNDYSQTQKIDITKAEQTIKTLTSYYRGDKQKRNQLVNLISLENKWYHSLKQNQPDYSVYDDDYYFADLWACWAVYSRSYLRSLLNHNSLNKNESIFSRLGQYKTILDLGCGIAYTTAALKQIFGKSEVYGTNLENTKQFDFCMHMSKKYSFNLVPDISKINRTIDLIFASEYFEHIEKALGHLKDIVSRLQPKCLIIANAFNTRSVGHFNHYKFEEKFIPQKDMNKLFSKILDLMGYAKMETRLWNNRPSIWVQKNSYFFFKWGQAEAEKMMAVNSQI